MHVTRTSVLGMEYIKKMKRKIEEQYSEHLNFT